MNTLDKQKKIDIVVGSKKIRDAIISRKIELQLTNSDIIKESKRCGVNGLTKTTLSIFFNNDKPVSGYPTQKHIIFMCLRYGISIGLKVEKIEPYNDDKSRTIAERFAKESQ